MGCESKVKISFGMDAKIKLVDELLPQTQCKDCGFSGCEPYARAMALGEASIDKCTPGGLPTLEALGSLLTIDIQPYVAKVQAQTRPATLALIKEDECIGCTKCIQACPVDAIIGSGKYMHTVLAHECTGCGLCVEPCPVDCIELLVVEEPSYDKERARMRFQAKNLRHLASKKEARQGYEEKKVLLKEEKVSQGQEQEAKKNYILAAMERAQAKKAKSL